MSRRLLWPLPFAAAVFTWWVLSRGAPPAPDPHEPTWVDEVACQRCHAAEVEAWRGSDHHRAMALPSDDTVLGDFEDASLETDTERTRFFREGGAHWIRTAGPDGAPADFRVAYTFGVDPLQQYLLRLPDGRLQAHGAAWDVLAGRWFHLYAGEGVGHEHRLHWTGAQQNADFMCLECHTTGFERRHDPETRTFDSRWHAPGVGCQACHGPASAHLRWAESPQGDTQKGFSREAVESCARCHSRRTPLGGGGGGGEDFLDAYLPMLLSAELYEVDGKIRGEVFEYGSFRQSRMHAAGVRCTDCHGAHDAGLRAPGDAVCIQCHSPAATPIRAEIDASGLRARDYAEASHHHHPEGSAGARCVSCHMPGRVYMGNDLRRDHSFGSPHPPQARALGHSDACLGCHAEEEAEVLAAFDRWYPGAAPRDGGYAQALFAARREGSAAGLLAQLARADLPDIRRATLLAELPAAPSIEARRALIEGLQHPSPLVRRSAVEQLGALFSTAERSRILPQILDDPVRAVRLAAAWAFLQLPPVPGLDPRAVIAEYERVQGQMLERAESHFNLAGVYQRTGREAEVEPALRRALRLDPHFTPALVFLAEWRERALGDASGAARLLDEALARAPEEAALWHAKGLMQVRRGARDEALRALRRAYELAPEDPNHGYVFAVALRDGGRAGEALDLLRRLAARHPAHRAIGAARAELEAANQHRPRP